MGANAYSWAAGRGSKLNPLDTKSGPRHGIKGIRNPLVGGGERIKIESISGLAAAKLSYMKSVLLGGISANLNSTIRYL